MSKAKKKKIKERKFAMRKAQHTAERVLSALEDRPVKIKENLANRIKG